jgi:hypothetical protein
MVDVLVGDQPVAGVKVLALKISSTQARTSCLFSASTTGLLLYACETFDGYGPPERSIYGNERVL